MKLFEQNRPWPITADAASSNFFALYRRQSTLTPHLRAIMQDAEEQTAHFTKMSLVIAISYMAVSGTSSMPAAKSPNKWKKALTADAITQDDFVQHLSLSDLPAVDMLIPYGGRLPHF